MAMRKQSAPTQRSQVNEDDSAVRELVYRPDADPRRAAQDTVKRAIAARAAAIRNAVAKLTDNA